MNFADRLMDAIDRKGTPSVVGIDPRYEMLPPALFAGEDADRATRAGAFLDFGKAIVDAAAPLVPAVKPNIAFYEALGWEGVKAYMETVAYAQEQGLLVIADVKRGDIGSTAQAYAKACFEEFGVDAVTLSPWLGEDSLRPFFEYGSEGKGFFLLVKTSNPSSADLQDLALADRTVFEAAADLVVAWGADHVGERGYSSVCAVVGATHPEQAATLRGRMQRTPFLLPGYGAQGGKAESLRNAFDAKGYGAVVNSSRGIIFAHAKEPYATDVAAEDWPEAVRRAIHAMRADLAGAVPDATWAG